MMNKSWAPNVRLFLKRQNLLMEYPLMIWELLTDINPGVAVTRRGCLNVETTSVHTLRMRVLNFRSAMLMVVILK
jgi:hypothetical protein